jgi:sulfoxide reductase heme-binding subunit YedZ
VNDAPLFWNLARASGFVAYGLLAVTILFGLTVKTRILGRRVSPAAVTDIHRVLSLLGLGMIALHGAGLVLDSVVEISPLDLVVPGVAGYRPVWTAFGVVAAWLALTVHVSFSLRRKIGARNWRRLHWLTYGVFVSATVHGVATGTDSTSPWALAIYGGLAGAVVGATFLRATGVRTPSPRAAPAGSADSSPGRLRPVALVIVGLLVVSGAGALANVALLNAARPVDVPVGVMAPLARTHAQAPKSPPVAPETPADRTGTTSAPASAAVPRAVPRARAVGEDDDGHVEYEGADDDD